jgi:uncharacterized protein (DUF1697 family)
VNRVALLRGVNVGRNRRIAMADLRRQLEAAGHGEVKTVGQSGNVVFASRASAKTLERTLTELIGVEVLVRTAEELAAVVALDPLDRAADNGSRHLVTFCRDPVDAALVRSVTSAPEEVAVHGREIYSWHPDGLQGSELAKLLGGKKLGVVATGRNWNTVAKLHGLTDVR